MSARKIPIIPTVVVLAAAAIMVALGVWQLGRSDEKAALIAQYGRAAQSSAPLTLPLNVDIEEALFRPARYSCDAPGAWRGISARNRNGQSGYGHYVTCGAASGGELVEVGIGWSRNPAQPDWDGGVISGLIGPGGEQSYILIAEEAQADLQPLARPDPNDMPNNHLAYAGQWFFFALTALVIYWLAIRRRWREGN